MTLKENLPRHNREEDQLEIKEGYITLDGIDDNHCRLAWFASEKLHKSPFPKMVRGRASNDRSMDIACRALEIGETC